MANGLTVIEAVVAPPGDHKYVPPVNEGAADKVALSPWQMAVSLTVSVASGSTVTFTESTMAGPVVGVKVTTYVVVAIGATVIIAVL